MKCLHLSVALDVQGIYFDKEMQMDFELHRWIEHDVSEWVVCGIDVE